MSDIYTDEHVTSTEGVCLCVCVRGGGVHLSPTFEIESVRVASV